MSDYIKREDVIETVYKLREHFKCWDRDDDIAIKNTLNAIPPADVVEVVRCKDCKYRDIDRCGRFKSNVWVCNEDYCSYGERADE